MRGRWELKNDDLRYWQVNAASQTLMLTKDKIKIVDLTKENITPYQINQVLESISWKKYKEKSGLEGDMYIYYKKQGFKDIVLYINIFTFEVIIFSKKDMHNEKIKQNHIKEMLN